MATLLTCGTSGRTYSTIQAAENAIPATPTGGYEIQCYNDSEFTDGVIIAGHTTSGTNYVKLTAAAGQSFQDHASVRSNPLFYDATKGVGITIDDTDGAWAIQVDEDFVTIDRLQVKRTNNFYVNNSGQGLITFSNAYPNSVLKDCICAKTYSGTNPIIVMRDAKAINVVVSDSGATGTSIALGLLEKGSAINCTVVRIGAASGNGIVRTYTNNQNTLVNSMVFGWLANFDGTTGWTAGSGYNCTDSATAPGSNNQVSKTFSTQVTSTTNDFRLKAGSDCEAHGNTDATNAPLDISLFTRGLTTAGDIGAWEYSAAGGGGGNALSWIRA